MPAAQSIDLYSVADCSIYFIRITGILLLKAHSSRGRCGDQREWTIVSSTTMSVPIYDLIQIYKL